MFASTFKDQWFLTVVGMGRRTYRQRCVVSWRRDPPTLCLRTTWQRDLPRSEKVMKRLIEPSASHAKQQFRNRPEPRQNAEHETDKPRKAGQDETCTWRISRSRIDLPASTHNGAARLRLRPISLLRISILRFVDSSFPGNSLWTREFHPLRLRFCLSQTLCNPKS